MPRVQGSGRAGTEGPGAAIWGAPAGAITPVTYEWNIATSGDTPGVSPEHYVLPAFDGYYAKLTFTTGQPGDGAPFAGLNENPLAGGVGVSNALEIAYNQSPYNSPGVLLPDPGGFVLRFRFTPPIHGRWFAYEWVPGTDMYFHASMSSAGHTGNPQAMQLLASNVPIP